MFEDKEELRIPNKSVGWKWDLRWKKNMLIKGGEDIWLLPQSIQCHSSHSIYPDHTILNGQIRLNEKFEIYTFCILVYLSWNQNFKKSNEVKELLSSYTQVIITAYVNECVCVCVCVCVYIYIYIYMCVCVCVYERMYSI